MSMILDALSRAEQERRNETSPHLDPTRYVGPENTKQDKVKTWLLIALIVNIILVSGFAIAYFLKQNSTQTITHNPQGTIEQVVIAPPETVEPVATSKPELPVVAKKTNKLIESKDPETEGLSLQQQAVVEKKPVANQVSKKKVVEQVAVAKKPRIQYASQPLSAPQTPVVEQIPAIPATNTSNLLSVTDLSNSERSQLAQYEINVHVFDSEPSARFVLVNMIKHKEGDRLPNGGPIIDTITSEGMVVDFGRGKVLWERN